MKYWVAVHDQTVEVEVTDGTVRVDGRPVTAAIDVAAGSAVCRLTVDGKQRVLTAVRIDAGWAVSSDGEATVVGVETERSRRVASARVGQGAAAASGLVRAPMPGLVLRVDVTEGDEVVPGDGLVVLEAMKMENVIKAGVGGRVKRVHVSEGAVVEKGTLLVDIEAAS